MTPTWDKGRTVRAALCVTVVVLSAVGVACSRSVTGLPRTQASAADLLPTEGEMSSAVGNPLRTYDFKPFVGGLEIMPDGFRVDADAAPIRCVGVTETMLRVTYEKSDVVEAARQSYFNLDRGVAVSGADAAIVRLVSAAAADELYQRFSADWRSCNGQTVVKHLRGISGADVSAEIGDVVSDGPMLSATVVTRQGVGPQSHYARALARRGATIVEVSFALTAGAITPARSDAALRVARVMIGKAGP